jgi:hypothetical protein
LLELTAELVDQLFRNGTITENGKNDWIAAQVGYADATTLRPLLRREVGRAVSELRISC